MEELVLEGVVVRRLDEELRAEGLSDNCTLIARPHSKACSVQLKCGECTTCLRYTCFSRHVNMDAFIEW